MAGRPRCVQIRRESDNKLLAVQEATSLKAGLEQYFKNTLQGYGYTKPKVIGNVLTVRSKMGAEICYVATEAK